MGSLAPLGLLVARALGGTLGSNPIAEVLNLLGLTALIFLVAALACTPLRILFGWGWPARVRRMLGLFGFFYAALHVATYLFIDQGFDWRAIAVDVLKHKFIFVGAAAFLLLIPLALTSTTAAIKRLGAVRWKRLHRLAYLSAALGVVHFYLRVKKDVTQPVLYGVVLAVLLAVRLVVFLRKRNAVSRRVRGPELSPEA